MKTTIFFALFCGFFTLSGVVRAEDEMTVKAVTFNIRFNNPADGPNRWPERREMTAEMMRGFDADFLGLQEALPDQIADLLKMLPGYRSLGSPRGADGKGGEASPIFYRLERWRADENRQDTFWLSDTPYVPGSITWGNAWPRIVTWGRFIDKETGRGLYVFNTHFDNVSAPSREKGAALLAERIALRDRSDPVLLTGDFNTGESSPPIEYLTGKRPGSPVRFIDTFRALHADERDAGTFHAFTGKPEPDKIDYVFALPDARVVSAEIVRFNREGRYPSDHFPVAAEVAFPTMSDACGGRTWAEPIGVRQPKNLYKVSDELYRSGQMTRAGAEQLRCLGVNTVVSLRMLGRREARYAARSGMNFVQLPFQAWQPDESQVVEFLKIAADKNCRPVCVYCNRGAERTGMMCAAYRVVVQGWSKEEAVCEMTQGPFGYHSIWKKVVQFIWDMDVERIRREVGLAE